jgi:hypothetical protein
MGYYDTSAEPINKAKKGEPFDDSKRQSFSDASICCVCGESLAKDDPVWMLPYIVCRAVYLCGAWISDRVAASACGECAMKYVKGAKHRYFAGNCPDAIGWSIGYGKITTTAK